MIKSMFATVAAAGAGMFGLANTNTAKANPADHSVRTDSTAIIKKTDKHDTSQEQPRLFSGVAVHNGLVFVAGKGEHSPGDIRDHTKAALDKIQEELESVGSSMEKALQVTVYLNDIRDYQAMNEVYRGRFGDNPPVRSTVACPSSLPGSTTVEIDCIAAL